jgi:phosphatidylinositol alpha 1,6-mannosyltransferase
VRVPSAPLPGCRQLPVGLPTQALTTAFVRHRPDVVYLASPFLLGHRAALHARELGIPIVAVFQTDLAGFVAQYRLGALARPVWNRLERTHALADVTLAPSSATVAELRRRAFPRVVRWARGVDTARFTPLARRRPPTGRVDTVRIGYVGRLAREKHVERLTALADLEGIELVVVGDGADRARLERRLPSARFTGALSGEALSTAYADLDVFVHTGTHETFCQAVQEALASGVPVVAAAAGGPLDLVAPGRNGELWDPRDATGLRAAVERLVVGTALRERLAAAARPSVAHRTWPRIVAELEGHLERLVGTPATAGTPGACDDADRDAARDAATRPARVLAA